jgi:hypothetical protein
MVCVDISPCATIVWLTWSLCITSWFIGSLATR